MNGCTDLRRRVAGDRREAVAHRVRERDVRNEAPPEKRADTPLRSIEELIGDQNVERPVFFFQAAYGAGRQNLLDAEHLEAEDVRAKVELGRQQAMADAVT